ncbi:universal stress protein [Haloglomus halophilum]|uniref:universal stress protein n=1 Tax=Haloglomus halophilum TaxID=2962672 RepID=UPI0020CA1ECF|nr:universal stress protein [Haloglomus halophilum]
MYDRILVATDGSETADTAVEGAVRLADRFGADLHAIHVTPPDDGGPPPDSPDEVDPDALLEEVTAHAAESDVLVSTAVLPNEAGTARAIADYAEAQDVDLLVMGTQGRTGLDRFVLGSVTERTLRVAPAPVLTVRTSTPVEDLDDVLVATDGSEGAAAAVTHAVDLAAAADATLHVIHVVDVTVAWPTGAGGPLLDRMEESGQEAVERAVERAGRADIPSVEATLLSGSPYRAIVDYAADTGVDLTVVGTHGRSGFDRFLLGSVAERVVRTAGTPVLALKAADAEPAETDWTDVHET